ncbi:MAG TPA: cytochrome c [Verrucomicrobiae bacterium]|nr:cytochrome c [Verrucomicrobiae bacterium]
MKKILRSLIVGLGAVTLLLAQMVLAQTKVVKEVNAQPSMAYTGAELWKQYCAVCHGVDGRGNGPAVSALVTRPNDLTQLTKQNNGKYPQGRVRDIIMGEQTVTAHGTKEMPMWGDVFRSISPNQSFTEMRITNLVLYIQSIQR